MVALAQCHSTVEDTDDWCIIKDEGDTEYYIRTTLAIPIIGTADSFLWGLWVTQSQESFERYRATFDSDQSDDGSFGWLAVTMAPYQDPDEPLRWLECAVHWGPAGERPKLELWECDHPLAQDQHNGISIEKAAQMATGLLHG